MPGAASDRQQKYGLVPLRVSGCSVPVAASLGREPLAEFRVLWSDEARIEEDLLAQEKRKATYWMILFWIIIFFLTLVYFLGR